MMLMKTYHLKCCSLRGLKQLRKLQKLHLTQLNHFQNHCLPQHFRQRPHLLSLPRMRHLQRWPPWRVRCF
jgi:hypothetical protein